MESQRAKTIKDLIDECGRSLCDLTKWPESEATKEAVERNLKAFRKAFHEDSYPNVFLYFAILHIAGNIWTEGVNRDIKFSNFKLAWTKLAELFDGRR